MSEEPRKPQAAVIVMNRVKSAKTRAAAVIVVDRDGEVVETGLVDSDRMEGLGGMTRTDRHPEDGREFILAQVVSRDGRAVACIFEERVYQELMEATHP